MIYLQELQEQVPVGIDLSALVSLMIVMMMMGMMMKMVK